MEYFTEKLYSHQYFVGRREAKDELGLKTVVNADMEFAKLMTALYEEYAKEMELGKQWNPEMELGQNASVNRKDFKIAFVESAASASHFNISMEFSRQQVMIQQITPQGPVQVPQEQVAFRILEQGWK